MGIRKNRGELGFWGFVIKTRNFCYSQWDCSSLSELYWPISTREFMEVKQTTTSILTRHPSKITLQTTFDSVYGIWYIIPSLTKIWRHYLIHSRPESDTRPNHNLTRRQVPRKGSALDWTKIVCFGNHFCLHLDFRRFCTWNWFCTVLKI